MIALAEQPAEYRRALAKYSDSSRSPSRPETRSKRSVPCAGATAALRSSATYIETFYRGLQMQAVIAPLEEFHLPRIAQLVGKTNQFNLRRSGIAS